MKLRSISKLFYRYLDQLELAAGMEHLNGRGITPCFETLDIWVNTRLRAVRRRNKTQLRFIDGLMKDRRLAKASSRIAQLAVERGLIKE